ncbi:MAG TPA: multicopper oxidase domain-containing protein [Gemmatimonadales bacterium]
MRWLTILCLLVGPVSTTPVVQPNDNRLPAGTRHGDTLRLALVVQMATWRPEADDGPAISVAAFGEVGGPPQVPAPLIRVPVGTIIAATVRNALTDSALIVRGLHAHPADPSDSLVVAPGATGRVVFAAGAPGTYAYAADLGTQDTLVEREQLGGAFVVDSAGARTDDRIFVMNIWGNSIDSLHYANALTINGKSWPYTEPIMLSLGDTARWRWVNATDRNHPMHLHGFFFRVDSRGSPAADTIYAAEQRRWAVTEELRPYTTMAMVWSPERPGNWLFHCHIAFHVVPGEAQLDPTAPDVHGDAHMAGLILGVNVPTPPGWRPPPRGRLRRVTLALAELPRHGGGDSLRTVGVAIADAGAPLPPARSPGPMLVVTKNQPTDVTVINHLAQGTGIHWHGIELESYSDGVVGWSGVPGRLAPAIAPGDSFVAHLTLPRAGTFIYHTHLHDMSQLTAGLYGPIVVLEPGERFDPRTDHVFTVGWDGPADPPRLVVNGDSMAPALVLAGGTRHRLRFINIGAAQAVRITLQRDSVPTRWQPVAKDGIAPPAWLASQRNAVMLLRVGETFDAEFTPVPGEYVLEMRRPSDSFLYYRRVLTVR